METEETPTLAWSVAKILVGTGLLALIIWKLPIVEMLYLCAMICIIPLTAMYLTGMITTETVNLFFKGAGSFRQRVESYMDEIKDEEAAAA